MGAIDPKVMRATLGSAVDALCFVSRESERSVLAVQGRGLAVDRRLNGFALIAGYGRAVTARVTAGLIDVVGASCITQGVPLK